MAGNKRYKFSAVPQDVWMLVLHFLQPSDVHNVKLVSKYFNLTAKNPAVWTAYCISRQIPIPQEKDVLIHRILLHYYEISFNSLNILNKAFAECFVQSSHKQSKLHSNLRVSPEGFFSSDRVTHETFRGNTRLIFDGCIATVETLLDAFCISGSKIGYLLKSSDIQDADKDQMVRLIGESFL